MKYINSAGVVHRDLKPGNTLINENCDLKICDFGLARVQEPHMTGNISTSHYRAPEIILAWQRYDEQVDIWSAGCIFAEMLQGKPLFPGQGLAHQFRVITEVLGTPPEDVVAKITTPNTLSFIESLPKREAKPLSDILPSAGLKAIDLLGKTLVFDPHRRVSEALPSPYLAPYHDPTDEPKSKLYVWIASQVITLWYRCLEILLGGRQYSTGVDMWSVGAIFAEMYTHSVLGTPDEELWPDVTSFPDYKATFPKWKRTDASIVPGMEPAGLELLEALLEYDPAPAFGEAGLHPPLLPERQLILLGPSQAQRS
ncbi:hypothetical protein N7467_012061 [Penicillium canescens]|nr:hypothetical protein N7467_012061 [Penicillium canescens]